MNIHAIETLGDLRDYLVAAIQLEHATIPPYLCALYSIKEGTNFAATEVVGIIVREEMLHLSLAANMLNAIGGKPDLAADDFVATYPTRLQDGEDWFTVGLERFCEHAIDTFLNIEMPRHRKSGKRSAQAIAAAEPSHLKVAHLAHATIGDFYEAILEGFKKLVAEKGAKAVFTGDPNLQVHDLDQKSPEEGGNRYYYAGGGKLFPIFDMNDVERAIELISDQGEGYDGTIFANPKELAHYYRFLQLKARRKFTPADKETKIPTGDVVAVDYSAVYPILPNARYRNYGPYPEIHRLVEAFAKDYRGLLSSLNEAFNGRPERLLEFVPQMMNVGLKMRVLIRIPLPDGCGQNVAPIFRLP